MDESAIVARLSALTPQVALEIAAVYGDGVVFPGRIVVDHPDDPERRFPGWPTSVLVISIENQGVCAWGAPIDEADPAIVVGGDLVDGSDRSSRTVRYACDVEAFIAARRWDATCLGRQPLIQAQSTELDHASLSHLRSRYGERPPSTGWPAATTFRFDDTAVQIMLWAGVGQCDWWISGTDVDRLEEGIATLLPYADLRRSLWSHDKDVEELLARVRDHLPLGDPS